jgi:hypothetical protein
MGTVTIGSACIDEHGKARGGDAGNQSGRELRIQSWYKHEKGWVVIRAKSAEVRAKIADAMRKAVANKKIGYDQNQRDTLYNRAKFVGFDPSRITTACETDCSALVRVCCAFAGITVGSFRTYNEPAMLKATGKFDVLKDSIFTDHSDRLVTGDILCTPVSGHTVVVLNTGSLATVPAPNIPDEILRFGDEGTLVGDLQQLLIKHGAKGLTVTKKFGGVTRDKVEEFQEAHGLHVDGEVGRNTWTALLS